MRALARNFILQIDRFLDDGSESTKETVSLPSVINFMPFSTLRLRGRNANRLVRPLLKVIHKATGKYYVAQQEENQYLRGKIQDLEFRLQKIERSNETEK